MTPSLPPPLISNFYRQFVGVGLSVANLTVDNTSSSPIHFIIHRRYNLMSLLWLQLFSFRPIIHQHTLYCYHNIINTTLCCSLTEEKRSLITKVLVLKCISSNHNSSSYSSCAIKMFSTIMDIFLVGQNICIRLPIISLFFLTFIHIYIYIYIYI